MASADRENAIGADENVVVASKLTREPNGDWRRSGDIDVQLDVRNHYLVERGQPRRNVGEILVLIVDDEMITLPADQVREALNMQPVREMPSHAHH